MADFSDESLLLEFVTESREHLAAIEPDLLVLERDGQNVDDELINRIFRAIHSVKGASGFFGLEAIKQLSHVMENLLMQIRDKKIVPNSATVEPLLQGVDKLNEMFENVQASDTVEYAELQAVLEGIVNGEQPVEAPKSPKKKTAPKASKETGKQNPNEKIHLNQAVSPETIKKLMLPGQKAYTIEFQGCDDLKDQKPAQLEELLKSFGVVITEGVAQDPFSLWEANPEHYASVTITFATVLELDLLAQALSLNPARITPLELPAEPKPLVEASSQGKPAPEVTPEPDASASPVKRAPVSGEPVESIRVRVDLLNKLMDLAGEMVLSRNQLLRKMENGDLPLQGLSAIIQNIDLITTDLQEHIMQTRMQPIGTVFNKFPRVIRDLARQMGKEIELQMSGDDVELDKSIIESLSDPLTHLIRNSCDHGIEAPQERLAAGKKSVGRISLRAYHEDGQINVSIADDGRGIDTAKLVRKAVEKGLISEADVRSMTHQEMANLIFLPGLSTAETISDLSGRGVGMDVVKTNISKLGGTIQVETVAGRGSTFLLRLPLTLAIIPSLIVGVSGQRFAMPQINLVELVRIPASEISTRIEKIGTASVLRLRGKLLPLLRLADTLKLARTFTDPLSGNVSADRRVEIADLRYAPNAEWAGSGADMDVPNRRTAFVSDYNVMVLRVGSNQFGLIVDDLFDTEEIVVKPLSRFLKNCKCFSGATILGDGQVAMILDPNGIITQSNISFEQIDAERQRLEALTAADNHSEQNLRTVLLFNNAEEEVFAIPLSSVLRLEKVPVSNLARIGSDEFLTYPDKALPVIRLEKFLPVKPLSQELKEVYVIIPAEGNGASGILVSEIIDTVETSVKLDHGLAKHGGIEGTAMINGHLTVFVDTLSLLSKAGLKLTGEQQYVA